MKENPLFGLFRKRPNKKFEGDVRCPQFTASCLLTRKWAFKKFSAEL